MKNILIVLGMFISTLSFSQVEDATFTTRYTTFYEYNTYSDEFEKVNEGWMNAYLTCTKDYYYFQIEDGDGGKVFWEYDDANEYGWDVYFTEDDRKIVFNYDEQLIIFYYEYNKYKELYTKYMVLTKISKE